MRDNYNDFRPWTGVDLDGTLAFAGLEFNPYRIGKPIGPMQKRVIEFLKAGKRVKIFTARVSLTYQRSPISGLVADEKFVNEQHDIITDWLLTHFGVDLEITAVKDALCEAIYDDRAWRVDRNLGHVIGEQNGMVNAMFNLRPGDKKIKHAPPEGLEDEYKQ